MDALVCAYCVVGGTTVVLLAWTGLRARPKAKASGRIEPSAQGAQGAAPSNDAALSQFELEPQQAGDWQADFTAMTLSVLRPDALMSEEPVLYELSATEEGMLRMRPNDESRQIMVANIESRLADHRAPYHPADEKRDREKLAELHARTWRSIPEDFSQAIHKRYAAFLRRKA